MTKTKLPPITAESVQVFIDTHHQRCIAALQKIAALFDTGSEEHKAEFAAYYSMGEPPSGWRVAEGMRWAATDALGHLTVDTKVEDLTINKRACESMAKMQLGEL